MRAFFIALLLLASFALNVNAQDNCPKPRVRVTTDIGYYEQLPFAEHLILSLINAVSNNIIAQNKDDIDFSSLAVPGVDIDYSLTLVSAFNNDDVQVLVKIVDNNNRLVLNFQSEAYNSVSTENLNNIALEIARDISPLISRIKDHQYLIRNTSKAAISSKFELDKLSHVVKVNQKKRINFILKDCDGVVLPGRTVILIHEGSGKIDKTTCTVDENGRGEFTYSSPDRNGTATVSLLHRYEDVAGNDNQLSDITIKFNTTGKLWLLVNHVTERAEIYIVGEHIGELEMKWDSDNTRGGTIAAFSNDVDKELWSSSIIELIEMKVTPAGEDLWKASGTWWPGSTTIKTRQQGGYEIKILWPTDDGTSIPVSGTITFEKPKLFDQIRRKYIAATRGVRR